LTKHTFAFAAFEAAATAAQELLEQGTYEYASCATLGKELLTEALNTPASYDIDAEPHVD